MFSSKDLFFTPSTGYRVSNSLRFRSSASAYLGRTPASASNRTTYTWSGWVKRGIIGSGNITFFGAGSTLSDIDGIQFLSDALQFYTGGGNAGFANLTATQVCRDPSAWYHIVAAVDTTQATASNRVKIYVNGVQVTAFSTAQYPNQNTVSSFNNTVRHAVGCIWYNTSYVNFFDGYLAEINFIDGQALTPSSFGETDATTGVWKPKAYAGTYGTNGFYLKFADNSAATAAAIGKDSSGNGNNWTPNNISVTAGTTYDSMIDTPTPYDDGGNGVGNYCTVNPINGGSTTVVPSNGNLTVTWGAAQGNSTIATTQIVRSGKWYFEATLTTVGGNYPFVGIIPAQSVVGSAIAEASYTNANWVGNGQLAANDVVGVAFDLDALTFTAYKNGVAITVASGGKNSDTIVSGQGNWVPAVSGLNSTVWNLNFGQRPFAYTPPSGFKALNTQNLPTPTIAAGNAHMDATIYSGNSSLQNVANAAGFQPDFVWIKNRSSATDHILNDAVRGAGNYLISNLTNAQATNTIIFAAFNSNGFQVNNAAQTNSSGSNYVAWQWKANGAGSSNTSGSITSTVSANATAGFSVVGWTGTGANATVGHGLGVAPKFIIVKQRDTPTNWPIFHTSMGGSNYMYLNTTGAQVTDTNYWNGTAPTASVFSLGSNGQTNFNGYKYIAYCFTDVAGYSAFGSYTGNGSADGPFVYTGFRPRWLMVKRTDAAYGWQIFDTSRSTYNVVQNGIDANTSNAEYISSVANTDILSNGFKLRTTDPNWNASGGTYIYAAFAENPLKYSLAR